MSDYTPNAIPGLETEHPAISRPGLLAPDHDQPTPLPDVDMLGIRAAIYRYRHHVRSFHDPAQPPGPELHDILVEGHGLLAEDRSTAANYLRRQIEDLVPAVRSAPSDTDRLDWTMARYGLTREMIDRELSR